MPLNCMLKTDLNGKFDTTHISPQFLKITNKNNLALVIGPPHPTVAFTALFPKNQVLRELPGLRHKLPPFVPEAFSLGRSNCIPRLLINIHSAKIIYNLTSTKISNIYPNGLRALARQVNNCNFILFRLKAYCA